MKDESNHEKIITRCGYRCDLCLAYKENIHGPEDQQKISDGWFKYFGFRIPPEEINCDGCLTSVTDPHLMDPGCPVRRCVAEKRLETCATCADYPCSDLKLRMVDRQDFGAKFPEGIPDEDYASFIRPYESKKVLESLRCRAGESGGTSEG